MIDLTGISHHPAIEEIVEVLCNKTQNTDKGFFRAEVAYFLGKMASIMRATIVTKDRSLSAQWEHTVLVTPTGFEVLTTSAGCQPAPAFVRQSALAA